MEVKRQESPSTAVLLTLLLQNSSTEKYLVSLSSFLVSFGISRSVVTTAGRPVSAPAGAWTAEATVRTLSPPSVKQSSWFKILQRGSSRSVCSIQWCFCWPSCWCWWTWTPLTIFPSWTSSCSTWAWSGSSPRAGSCLSWSSPGRWSICRTESPSSSWSSSVLDVSEQLSSLCWNVDMDGGCI